MSILNFKLDKIGTFLNTEKYYIPQYQRGYSWESSQIDDFWEDLQQLFNGSNQGEHFFGQIVVHNDKEENKRFIIDGQQRVSTSVIFLDVLRTKFDELFNEDPNNEDARNDADDINSQYIGRISETRSEEKLILSDANKDFFHNSIQKRGALDYTDEDLSKKKLGQSNYNILYASKFFNEKITKLLHDSSDPYITLQSIFKTFVDKFKVMSVETDDINEAYIIFETLNARGKDLETSDLLKNHIIRTSKHNMEKTTKQWNKMIENLSDNDPTKFIRYYWNSKKEFIREKDLYKALRKETDTPKKVKDLLDDLVSLSELYVALLSPTDNKYFESKSLNERIYEVNKINATSFFPIIFALKKTNFPESDIDIILEKIECLIVRNIVVSGKTANKYEVIFSKIALDISEQVLVSKEEIVSQINHHIISDEEFSNNFKLFKTKKTSVIRYILKRLNNYHSTETTIKDDTSIVHIEHILPKSPKKNEWTSFSDDDHTEFLWRLGNLSLLGHEFNNRAKNKEFQKKKEMYSQSDIKITKDLLDYTEWTIDSIIDRQNKFANIATDIWKK